MIRAQISFLTSRACATLVATMLSRRRSTGTRANRSFGSSPRAARESSRGYDCLIAVSGGKDSTWQTLKCLEYGLTPLTFTYRPPKRTAIGQDNLNNLISLGVDHIDYTINPQVEAQFLLKAFERGREPGRSDAPSDLQHQP